MATRTPISPRSCDEMLPAIAASRAWPMRSTPSARASPSRPTQIAPRLRRRRGRSACRSSCMPTSSPTCGGAALAARFGALSADHLEYTDEAGAAAMAQAGTVAVLLPGAFYFLRETQKPPVDAVPPARRADGGRHRLQSGHLAAHLAAARHEHGGDPVRPDGRGVPRRRDARGRAGAWPAGPRPARSRPANGPTSRSGTSSSPAELVYRMGFNPLHRRVWRGR